MLSKATVMDNRKFQFGHCYMGDHCTSIVDRHIMHSPTDALIGVSFLLVCFLLSSAMLALITITETNAIANMMGTVMVMTTEAELCCTDI